MGEISQAADERTRVRRSLRQRTLKDINYERAHSPHQISTTRPWPGGYSAAVAALGMALCGMVDVARACYIHGADIGYCETTLYDNSDYREAIVPFCSSYIKYSACVPKYDPLPPSRDFQDGRWFNNTMTIKDRWVQELYETVVNNRLEIEGDKELQKQGVDEYGNTGSPVPRFTENKDCQKAYKAYMCYINFPRCDDDGNSLVTCRSACENLMVACENQRDLWRCGDSKYFNGYEAEEPDYDSNGDPVYLRDFFPGQPFRDVEFTKGRADIVCTPSIKGSAPARLRPLEWKGSVFIPLLVTTMSVLLAI